MRPFGFSFNKIPVQILGLSKNVPDLQTFDLSETGLFLTTGSGLLIGSLGLKLNQMLELQLKVNSLNFIRVTGKITRIARQNGRYPEGLGVMFIEVSAADRKKLQKLRQPKERIRPSLVPDLMN